MTNEYEFKGISDPQDMIICMASLDKPFQLNAMSEEITFSEIFFPEAYKDGETLQHFAKDLWNAFEEVGRKHSLGIKEILMKHFMDAVFYCLKEFGSYKKQKYKPTKEDWMYSIEKIGFVQAY